REPQAPQGGPQRSHTRAQLPVGEDGPVIAERERLFRVTLDDGGEVHLPMTRNWTSAAVKMARRRSPRVIVVAGRTARSSRGAAHSVIPAPPARCRSPGPAPGTPRPRTGPWPRRRGRRSPPPA